MKKTVIRLLYGITRQELAAFLMAIASLVACLIINTQGALLAALLICLAAIGYMLAVKKLSDKSRRGAEILHAPLSKSYVICQKKGGEIQKTLKDPRTLHQCPSSLVRSENYNIIGSIKEGETYRTVTHGRMIAIMRKNGGDRVDIKVTKTSYKASVKKYEAELYDPAVCVGCEDEKCRIKKAKETGKHDDLENFYGVKITKR